MALTEEPFSACCNFRASVFRKPDSIAHSDVNKYMQMKRLVNFLKTTSKQSIKNLETRGWRFGQYPTLFVQMRTKKPGCEEISGRIKLYLDWWVDPPENSELERREDEKRKPLRTLLLFSSRFCGRVIFVDILGLALCWRKRRPERNRKRSLESVSRKSACVNEIPRTTAQSPWTWIAFRLPQTRAQEQEKALSQVEMTYKYFWQGICEKLIPQLKWGNFILNKCKTRWREVVCPPVNLSWA